MSGRTALAGVMLAFTLAGTLGGLALYALLAADGALAQDKAPGAVLPAIGCVPFGAVGAVVATRRSASPIGWLMLLIGTLIGTAYAAGAYAARDSSVADSLPGAAHAAWWSGSMWMVVISILIPRLMLVFPNGTTPSERWRVVGFVQAVILVGLGIVILSPGPIPDYTYQNPVAISALSGIGPVVEGAFSLIYWLMLIVIVAACLSLVLRFQRSSGVEREQLKWAASVVLIIGTAEALGALLQPLLPVVSGVASAIAVLGLIALPVAVGIAVLRYRLYEIDHIVSRTIGWAAVTAALVAVFAGVVIGLQGLLEGVTQGETLAVATSTLVAFALFQPLRRRIQAAVDRRFDRTRFDAELTAARFAGRVRGAVELESVIEELQRAVTGTVGPKHVEAWLTRPSTAAMASINPGARSDDVFS